MSVQHLFAGARRRHMLVCVTWLVSLIAIGGELWAGAPESPVQLLMDALETPRVGEPLTLHLTVVSQVKTSAEFQLQLTAPPGADVGVPAGTLSGTIAGGARRTIFVTVTPKQLGDFRVSARLEFLPDGASSSFVVGNAAVLRLRATPGSSDVFVDRKEWAKPDVADTIKMAKESLRRASQEERDRSIHLLQDLPAEPRPAEHGAPDSMLERQQSYRQAIEGLTTAQLRAKRAALKQQWVSSPWAGYLGSAERHANTDGLVRRGVPVSILYHRELALRAGEPYTFETRVLTPGSDTVAYLFVYDEATGQLEPVAQNDDADASTFGSLIAYTPPREGSYLWVVRSYNDETRGAADLHVNGKFLERASFAGAAFRITADAGEALHTVALQRAPNRADTLMFVLTGAAARWDDDGGMEVGSTLVLPDLRGAELVVGAYSQAGEGRCDVVLNTADGSDGAHPRGDLDSDGLSNELERALGTDPESQDTDGDGFLDSWEVLGIRDTDYPALGADGTIPDIYVQVDWMASTHNHQPRLAAIQMIMDSFAATGFNLHVDDGRPEEGGQGHLLPAPWTHLDFLSLGSATFREIKAANFDAAKRGGLYRYNIFAHRQPGSCSSGVASIRGFDSLVTLGCALGQIGSITDQAGTFMHELGHNLGLRHGGFENRNWKPNYRSVMNYLFQFPGTCGRLGFNNGVTFVACTPVAAREYFYSFGESADLDETCLDETLGIGEDPIDWNGDGTLDACVPADINYRRGGLPDRRFDVLPDYNDYSNLFIPPAGLASELEARQEEIIICRPPPDSPR